MEKQEILNRLATAVVYGDAGQSREGTSEALANGLDPLEAVEHGLSKGMDIVGADGYGQLAIQAVEAAKRLMPRKG